MVTESDLFVQTKSITLCLDLNCDPTKAEQGTVPLCYPASFVIKNSFKNEKVVYPCSLVYLFKCYKSLFNSLN